MSETSIVEKPKFTPEQLAIVTRTVAKGATPDELAMFMHLANKYGLDPFAKEMFFIKRGGDATIMTSRDGYLKIAQGTPEYEGLKSMVVKEGDEFAIDSERDAVTHKFGATRGKILGAWAVAYCKGRKPMMCFVDFEEYKSATSPTWQKYPSAMIQKVAEAFVLKRQFGITGLVTTEEMAQEKVATAVEDNLPEPPEDAVTGQIEASTEKPKDEPKPETEEKVSPARKAMLKGKGEVTE